MLTRSLRTDSLTRADIPAAVGLAVAALHCITARPGAFAADQVREHLPPFLETRIASNRAIGIHGTDGSLVGYAAYDQFPFHGDAAAFLPVMAYATAPEAAADLTELLYTTLAARWIRDGVRKHLVSLPPDRHDVEQRLFEIGFGRYVTVGMRDLTTVPVAPKEPPGADTTPTVRAATEADTPGLSRLFDESVGWYRASPIFLRFEQTPPQELSALIASPDSEVFVAEDHDGLAGFMGIGIVGEPRLFDCVAAGAATLDGIGAYLTEPSRGRGIGIRLLDACDAWARERGCPAIHVDFESANPAARAFWPRHFRPSIHSLMRVVHSDSA